MNIDNSEAHPTDNQYTVYPKECAHGFVVLCFVVVMQSYISIFIRVTLLALG